ncbi:hypothetical protein BJ742DRAFT_742591 [Cladochytrium replicatum]|nr:hypothetical protein BJ742DRAFT_742591 [Cladochytrium replicatum]
MKIHLLLLGSLLPPPNTLPWYSSSPAQWLCSSAAATNAPEGLSAITAEGPLSLFKSPASPEFLSALVIPIDVHAAFTLASNFVEPTFMTSLPYTPFPIDCFLSVPSALYWLIAFLLPLWMRSKSSRGKLIVAVLALVILATVFWMTSAFAPQINWGKEQSCDLWGLRVWMIVPMALVVWTIEMFVKYRTQQIPIVV